MKIRRPEQQDLSILNQVERTNEQTKASRAEADQRRILSSNGERVNLSLAKQIQEELSPEAIDNVNRNKIELIKQQIANGSYKMPSAVDLSERVARELTLEIMTSRRNMEDDE